MNALNGQSCEKRKTRFIPVYRVHTLTFFPCAYGPQKNRPCFRRGVAGEAGSGGRADGDVRLVSGPAGAMTCR